MVCLLSVCLSSYGHFIEQVLSTSCMPDSVPCPTETKEYVTPALRDLRSLNMLRLMRSFFFFFFFFLF